MMIHLTAADYSRQPWKNGINRIAEALGVTGDIRVEQSKRVGEVSHYIADISRAQELLGYQPHVSLEEGIKRAVAWSREWASSPPAPLLPQWKKRE